MTISPQVRLAVVGLLAAAGLIVSTQLVYRGMLSSSDSEPAVPASMSAGAKKTEAGAKPVAASKADAKNGSAKADGKSSSATGNTAKLAKASPKSPSATPTKAKAPTKQALRAAGLPVLLARALRDHSVVVVSLFTPKAAVDRLSRAEAQAGAREVGAGFVALDVLRAKNSEPLAAKLGALKTPSVLVYTRPAKLFVKLDGFADVATVAQAADNARR